MCGAGLHKTLHKQCLDLVEKALAEGAQRIMVGLLVRGDIAKGNRLIGRHLDAPARINACGVAVETEAMARLLGHRQTKGAATDKPTLPYRLRATSLLYHRLIRG